MSDDAFRLDASARLRVAPAATRLVGAELLVNTGGATAPVQRLGGIGPYLWQELASGRTIGELVDTLAEETGAPAERIHRVVVEFAARLVDADLAEAVPG
jgi:hypothetical protein